MKRPGDIELNTTDPNFPAEEAPCAPENPEEQLAVLTSTLEVAKVLKLKAPAFYDRNPSTPTESEAALVALGLVYGATREQYASNVSGGLRVCDGELAHGCGGESWSPPWTGDWVRPNGALQTLVVETLSPPTNACVCADALARFNAVHATSGAVRRRSEKSARGPPFSKRIPKGERPSDISIDGL